MQYMHRLVLQYTKQAAYMARRELLCIQDANSVLEVPTGQIEELIRLHKYILDNSGIACQLQSHLSSLGMEWPHFGPFQSAIVQPDK